MRKDVQHDAIACDALWRFTRATLKDADTQSLAKTLGINVMRLRASSDVETLQRATQDIR